MSPHPRYIGMTREQANKEAARLIAKAHETGDWVTIAPALTMLRSIVRTPNNITITVINQVPEPFVSRVTDSGEHVVIEIMRKAIFRGDLNRPIKR